MVTWDNRLYEHANDCVIKSWESWETNDGASAWKHSVSARLAYLCDMIVNLVVLPFAIIGVTFGSLHALITWNWQSSVFQSTKSFITKTSNHLFISLFGAVISPAIAHKYRDANLVPFIIAARIVIIAASLLVYLKKL